MATRLWGGRFGRIVTPNAPEGPE